MEITLQSQEESTLYYPTQAELIIYYPYNEFLNTG